MHPSTPLIVTLGAALLTACASMGEAEGPPRKELVWAANDAGELVKVNAGQPARVLAKVKLQGLAPGERLLGIDFRVSRGVLYSVSSSGRLLTIDTKSGQVRPVGTGPGVALSGKQFGVDFNPAADRVRLVSDNGMNLRLHPDTGALAASDPPLQYASGDARAGQRPLVTAAGYTYNKRDEKLTTNYAIDSAAGTLVMQGSKEGVQPAVSPNTGALRTVGTLGTGPVDDAAFDISDVENTPLAALRSQGRTRLYLLNLDTGRAQALGTVADGRPLWGMAIEP